MSGTVPFSPTLPTKQLASGTSATSVAIGVKGGTSQSTPTPQGFPTFPGGYSLRLQVVGTVPMQVEFGITSAIPTSASSMMLNANSMQVITLNPNIDTIAQLSSATGSTLFITPGEGGV